MKKKCVLKRVLLAVMAVAMLLVLFIGCASNNRLAEAYILAVADHYGYDENVMRCFTVENDGTIRFDTDPQNVGDLYSSNVIDAIEDFHEYLDIMDIWDEMVTTKYADGIQSITENVITVVWSYHPNVGLEATYSLA